MIWPMVIFGIALCTINIKSFIDKQKASADTARQVKRGNMVVNALSFLVGIGGILIGSGMFQQYMQLNETVLWVIVLCQFAVLIVPKLCRK